MVRLQNFSTARILVVSLECSHLKEFFGLNVDRFILHFLQHILSFL